MDVYGLSVFIISSLGYIKYTKWQLRNSYAAILKTLFKSGAKPPSRHHINTTSDSIAVVDKQFEIRKHYFKSIVGSHLRNKGASLEKLVRYIHIVGTKGKGSTGEYIRCGLQYFKKKIGVFTSPHMHTARERIKISDQLISMEDIVRLGHQTLQHSVIRESSWVVFFDYFLSIALYYFEEQQVDFVLLEGGIGGRYDSTNFIDRGLPCGPIDALYSDGDDMKDGELVVPLIAVITNISIDHQSVLGFTIEEIAMQKCGIIKPNSQVFTCVTSQNESVMKIIRQECSRLEATLYEVDTVSMTVCMFDPNSGNKVAGDGNKNAPPSSLSVSRHIDTASENRALASAVLLYFIQVGCIGQEPGICIGADHSHSPLVTPHSLNTLPEHMLDGFFWPCRMEKFHVPCMNVNTPTSTSINANTNAVEVILDGCHNGYSVFRFMDTLGRSRMKLTHPDPTDRNPPRSLSAASTSRSGSPSSSSIITLFGCGMEKENIIKEMVESVCRTSDIIVLVRSTHFKAMDVCKLYEYIPQEYRYKIRVVSSMEPEAVYVSHTLGTLLTAPPASFDLSNTKIAICGSLFIAAEAREYLYENFKSHGLFRSNDWVQYSKMESW